MEPQGPGAGQVVHVHTENSTMFARLRLDSTAMNQMFKSVVNRIFSLQLTER